MCHIFTLSWKAAILLQLLFPGFGHMLFYFCFLRKISPELISAANPLLFLLRKTGPELTSMPIFLYFIYVGHPPQHGLPGGAMSASGIQTGKPQATEAEHAHLTTAPPCQPQPFLFLVSTQWWFWDSLVLRSIRCPLSSVCFFSCRFWHNAGLIDIGSLSPPACILGFLEILCDLVLS